ncbi:MAG TPA: glycosyltransferase [Calditrichia bacterium]|nr:glycosyltransferase [Calditrichota bacterium]HQU72818.1 glycosyltransferase [Calditrichia bacterium]HQV30298.1 glycosyltransferase [Calditrichia bacterium]
MNELPDFSHLKVALIHDWLTTMRGGEKVLEVFCELFPSADLFTLLHNPGSVTGPIADRRIFTTFIDRLPLKAKRYRHYLPLFPTAIERFQFQGYDLILSSSHCVAKGVLTPPGIPHIAYVHTPMRYVWDMYDQYFGRDRVGKLQRMIIPFFANYLRMWDVTSAARVDHFIANSNYVAQRIQKFYRRDSAVIYPPVSVEHFPLSKKTEGYYLVLSALVPYKRIDLAVEAFTQSGKPLHIVGDGPEGEKLKARAGENIRFFDWLSDADLSRQLADCRALIFPGEEDFGIVPVEAQSCGKPVIAFGKGGALETVCGYDGNNEGQCSGIFFEEQSPPSLAGAVERFEEIRWDGEWIHRHAGQFSRERFRREMADYIQAVIGRVDK